MNKELLNKYLLEFKGVADEWLNNNIQIKHHNFFKRFYKKEKLENANWENFQEMGNYIHSFNSMALAKKRALGKPNVDISHYKKVLKYLLYSPDDLDLRIKNFLNNKEYDLPYFSLSSKSELIAQAFPDEYSMYNFRNKFGLKLLGIDKKEYKTSDPYTTYKNYAKIVLDIRSEYLNDVGHKSALPINLELDQFFSYLYEHYKDDELGDSKEQNIIHYWQIAPGKKARLWMSCLEKGIIRVGWNKLPDLSNIKTKEEFLAFFERYKPNSSGTQKKMLWNFLKMVKKGDKIIANKGKSDIVGVGTVLDSTYYMTRRVVNIGITRKLIGKLKNLLKFHRRINLAGRFYN